jgi:hypothetical protein
MGSHTFGVPCRSCNDLAYATRYSWREYEIVCFECGYFYDHEGAVFSFADLVKIKCLFPLNESLHKALVQYRRER